MYFKIIFFESILFHCRFGRVHGEKLHSVFSPLTGSATSYLYYRRHQKCFAGFFGRVVICLFIKQIVDFGIPNRTFSAQNWQKSIFEVSTKICNIFALMGSGKKAVLNFSENQFFWKEQTSRTCGAIEERSNP